MTKFAWISCVCAAALLAPARAENPKPDPAERTLAALQKQKPDIDGTKLGDLTANEVLNKLSKQLDVAVVILEDEFKAQKAGDLTNRKSPLKTLDTKALTAGQFLDVWLASLGATYRVHPDYIAISPLVRTEKATKPEKVDPAEKILSALGIEVALGDKDINSTPVFELVQDMSKKYGLTFVINEAAFKAAGVPNFKEEKPTLAATQIRGMKLHEFLRIWLDSMGATHLVKKNHIEIVPNRYAAEVTKVGLAEDETGHQRLKEPLVSLIVREKSLNDVVSALAEDYDLNLMIVSPGINPDARFVSARLLNVPADKVIELVALQCDLHVVRKNNVYVLTSKEQAAEMKAARAEKDRKKADADKLRVPATPVPMPKEK